MLARIRLLNFHATARVVGALLVALIVTSAALAKRAVEPAVETDGPAWATSSPASIVPNDVSSVTTAAGMTIAEVVAAVGDELQTGKPIARIDVTEGQRDLAELKLELDRARQDVVDRERIVALLQDSIERLVGRRTRRRSSRSPNARHSRCRCGRRAILPSARSCAYEQAQLRAQRLEQLAAQGLVSKQDVEDGQFAVALAADDLANASRRPTPPGASTTREAEQARTRRALSLAEQRASSPSSRRPRAGAVPPTAAEMRYDSGPRRDRRSVRPRAARRRVWSCSSTPATPAAGAPSPGSRRSIRWRSTSTCRRRSSTRSRSGDTAHVDVPAVRLSRARGADPIDRAAARRRRQVHRPAHAAEPDHDTARRQTAHVCACRASPRRTRR